MQLGIKGFQLSTAAAIAFLSILSFAPRSRAQDAPPTDTAAPGQSYRCRTSGRIEGVTGRHVDKDDHIWVRHRPRDFELDKMEKLASLNSPVTECCVRLRAVLEVDTKGNLYTGEVDTGKPVPAQ
jgi:hypothetical protein